MYTVWKFNDFSIIQTLREINFGDSTNANYAILTHLQEFDEFLQFLKAIIYQNNKIQNLKNGTKSSCRISRFSKIDFT